MMKLRLESLVVESFSTTGTDGGVMGYDQNTTGSTVDWGTCHGGISCVSTCPIVMRTCDNTCPETCVNTCAVSCHCSDVCNGGDLSAANTCGGGCGYTGGGGGDSNGDTWCNYTEGV
jgi:hypothetical protein